MCNELENMFFGRFYPLFVELSINSFVKYHFYSFKLRKYKKKIKHLKITKNTTNEL